MSNLDLAHGPAIEPLQRTIKLLLISAAALAALVALAYVAWFLPSKLSNDPKDWASLGSYLGGTLGLVWSAFSLLAVLLTLHFNTRVQQRIQTKELQADRQKRELIFSLLKDEFTLRWEGIILQDLQKLSAENDKLQVAAWLIDIQMRDDDLFVCHTIANGFSEYYFLEDHALISNIIYANVLMRDLADHQKAVIKLWNVDPATIADDLPVRIRELVEKMKAVGQKIIARVGSSKSIQQQNHAATG